MLADVADLLPGIVLVFGLEHSNCQLSSINHIQYHKEEKYLKGEHRRLSRGLIVGPLKVLVQLFKVSAHPSENQHLQFKNHPKSKD